MVRDVNVHKLKLRPRITYLIQFSRSRCKNFGPLGIAAKRFEYSFPCIIELKINKIKFRDAYLIGENCLETEPRIPV